MDTTVADVLVGRVLDRRYVVEDRLARGGMATVYRAVDLRLDRMVAVKVMHSTLADDEEFVARFIREAKAAARLSHPNTVAVYDQGTDDGVVFLVMEYVDGSTLRQVLHQRGRLPAPQALHVMQPVLGALAAAHAAGIVHRDVKPENVLIARDGTVKVADFGLARAVQSSTLTATGGLLIGTVAYLAPEQVERGVADPRSDVYAAGILCYELLTGAPPFQADNPLSVAYRHVHEDVPPPSRAVAGVPHAVDRLVRRATSRNPAGRPADAGTFLAELAAVAATLPAPDPGYLTRGNDTDVLDARTRPLARGSWAHPADTAVTPPLEPGDGAPARPRSPRRRWLLGALLLLLCVAAAVAGTLAGGYLHRTHYVSVPTVSGEKKSVAEQALKQAGLVVRYLPAVYSETTGSGRVISEHPTGRVAAHSVVDVTLSKGRQPHPVPAVAGDSVADARSALTGASLTVGDTIRYRYSETVASGVVMTTVPPVGTVLHKGDSVQLVVSKGRRPIPVPDVAGKALADAKTALSAAGLKVGHVDEQFSDTVDSGAVISESPQPGATEYRGDSVDLVVSKGPDVVQMPSVIGKTADDARSALEGIGLKVQIQSLFGGGQGRVVAQDPDPGTTVHRGSTVRLAVI